MATDVDGAIPPASPARSSELLAVQRLDRLLGRAVEAARERYGPAAPADAFRGLYVSAEQAQRSLAAAVREPLLAAASKPPLPDWDRIAADEPAWAWLRGTYQLSDLELDVVLIALGPEMDLRYERLYGYLQDDVTRRRPTVNLALDLLTGTAEERLSARGAFGPDAPLLRHRVLALAPDPRAVSPPLLAHLILLDGQIVDVLLRQPGLDRRLASCCRLLTPSRDGIPYVLPAGLRRSLLGMVEAAWGGRRPLRLHFHGPRGAGKRRAAESLAAELAAPLLVVDADRLPLADETLLDVLALVFREVSLHGALLYLDNVDTLRPEQRSFCRQALAQRLAEHEGVAILAGARAWTPMGPEPLGVLEVLFAPVDASARHGLWERALARHRASAAPADLDALAGRFRFGPGQIEDAVLTAITAARRRIAADGQDAADDTSPQPTREELFAAARGQTGHELAALTRKLEPASGWDDIVLPADTLAQLHELCDRVAHRQRVMGDWGFDRKLSRGKGISALFAGPPGTGKTMAAEVIARELGLDLFKINLSTVISKYIGETEKNLERVFEAATNADAILLFDEADALFGKRSEVRDSHDRYANIEIAYLLERMEQYDGLAILATNLRQHLDDAFTRRLQFVVEFPFPDETERRRIWQVCFPAEAPRDPAIDLERLAREFRLSGGNIKNIVLAAAFLAAAERAPISMRHLLHATRREHQKMGRVLSEAELGLDSGEG
jgi:SpoVK/Ycf46/Vps4 family AAA+-type ATPase